MMDDFMSEPEARGGHTAFDEFDEGDEFDLAEDAGDEFDEADELEAMDEFDEGDEFEAAEDLGDSMEDAMADALEAADTDEFFGKIGSFLRKVGRGVGSVARVVAPIASAIPIPQAQLIGRAAGLIGNVMADEGDELDAFDDLADYAEDEDAMDELAPVIATVALRSALKRQTAHLPHAARKHLVRTATAATRHLIRHHGPRAVMALPAIVGHAKRVLVRRGLPAKALPKVVSQSLRAAVKSPRVLTRLASAGAATRGRRRTTYRGGGALARTGARVLRRHRGHRHAHRHAGAGPAVCPSCGARRRSWRFTGPVRVTIEPV
jgi:hypothetical protein